MEAHRAADNIQQKASDCLGTENEWVFEPVFLGPSPIVVDYDLRHIRDSPFSGLLTDDSLNKLSVAFCDPLLLMKIANWKSSRCIVTKELGEYIYPFPRNDNPKKD